MRHRHHITAVSIMWVAFTMSLLQSAQADTYEFDLTREIARLHGKKIDMNALKKAAQDNSVKQLSENAEVVWQPPVKSFLVVKTGPDGLVIIGKDRYRIYDFKNKKIFDLNNTNKTYVERSLYADLAYRKTELKNRLALRESMAKALRGKHADKLGDDFYSEEKFSLCLPDKNSGYSLDKSTDGTTDIYKYGPTVVSAFKPTNVELSGAKLKEFSRFLIYGTHLHPEIRQDIEKSNRIPSKLVCYMENHHASRERTTLTLKKVTFEDYQVSIPPEFTKSVDPRSPLAAVYPRIKELGGNPPADLKQQTLLYYKNAVEKKNYFDALLAVSEYGLQTGENLTAEIAAIKNQIKDDPDCQRLIAGLNFPEDERKAMLALGSLDTIDRSRSGKSYLIDVYRADLIVKMNEHGMQEVAPKQEEDPSATFVRVLKQNPFISGVYLDLGDYLEASCKQSYAWECYEQAQKYYPNHPYMKDIVNRQQELAESFPQFFSGDKL